MMALTTVALTLLDQAPQLDVIALGFCTSVL